MEILRDISLTLKNLLTSISELNANTIIFKSPAEIDTATDGTRLLSVFLYQIVENNYLKNVGPQPVDLDKMQYPPLTLDLYYMFTPYDNDKENELIILEKVMQIFHDTPVLKGDMLKDSLKGTGNDKIRVIPNNLTFEEINKVWERFPNKAYKLSASYILTPVSIPSRKPPAMIKRVMEKEIDAYRMDR